MRDDHQRSRAPRIHICITTDRCVTNDTIAFRLRDKIPRSPGGTVFWWLRRDLSPVSGSKKVVVRSGLPWLILVPRNRDSAMEFERRRAERRRAITVLHTLAVGSDVSDCIISQQCLSSPFYDAIVFPSRVGWVGAVPVAPTGTEREIRTVSRRRLCLRRD